jgi:predicted RecB family nuclease
VTRPVLLGGYASKRCARATHNQFDVTVPEQPVVVSERQQALYDLGNEHEQRVFHTWLDVGVDVVDLRPIEHQKHAHIAATAEAMRDGRSVILGGRLPDDPDAGRTGKPDALIRALGGSGYYPCDVKAHLVLDKKRTGALVTDVFRPAVENAVVSDIGPRYREDDLLQLAHYWRMLEACGQQAARPSGAIVGTDQEPLPTLVWYDLTAPLFTTFSRTQGTAKRSSLERYDHEHEFRVRVSRTAQRRTGSIADPEPLVFPVGQEECVTCSWAPVCVDTLPSDDISRGLLGLLSVREYLTLRDEGVGGVDDLADADVDAILDSRYADETKPDGQRARRLRKAHVSAQLLREGLVLRLKPGAVFSVPRAEVEIDLDMECTRDGRVYLWGVLLTTAGESSFHPFVDLDVDDDVSEERLARECFDWICRDYPAAAVYHYSGVEKSHAQRILGSDLTAYSGSAADPETWIDLLPPVRSCLESRAGLGLKTVATEGADFHWRDEDPGGLQSQDWLDQARAGDADAARRILAYNEDDVRATLAVRNWLADATTPGGAARPPPPHTHPPPPPSR